MAETITIARPYAKAVFELANSVGKLDVWSTELSRLAAVASEPQVKPLLDHPGLTAEQKSDLVAGSCGEDLSAEAVNFVETLASFKRLSLLPDIQALFEQHRSELEATVDVTVESAFAIEDALQGKLAEVLQKRLERKVTLQTSINKDLIGGVVVRAGDTVIDASVRGKLAKLAEAVSS